MPQGLKDMHKVAVIVGSLRKASINKKLAGALSKLAEGKLDFRMIRIDDLPMLTGDDTKDDMPAAVHRFKEEVEACDAVLFVTPEHNRSVPAALKNAFDWGTRPPKDSWRGRPAAVLGTSPGNLGTAIAQQHMRTIASGHVSALMGAPLVFLKNTEGLIDADGTVTNEKTRAFLQGFVDQFAAFVGHMSEA